MPETNPSTSSSKSAAPAPSNGVKATNKVVLFGVEVDAPEGQDSGVVQAHLPKAKGTFMPIIIGLSMFALVGGMVFFWNDATNANKELATRTAQLEASTKQATELTSKLNESVAKIRTLEAEKATLTADLTAKTDELTKANEQLTAKGKKK